MYKAGGKITSEKEFDTLLGHAFLALDFNDVRNSNILEAAIRKIITPGGDTPKNSANIIKRIMRKIEYYHFVFASAIIILATTVWAKYNVREQASDKAYCEAIHSIINPATPVTRVYASSSAPVRSGPNRKNLQSGEMKITSQDTTSVRIADEEILMAPDIKRSADIMYTKAKPDSAVYPPNSIATSAKKDLLKMKLAGPVKSLRETSYKAVKKSGQVYKGKKARRIQGWEKDYYIVFNTEGQITETTEFKSNGKSEGKHTFQYDEKGKLIEEDTYNSDETLDRKHIYKYRYDEKGNTVEAEGADSDGGHGWKSIYTCDENNNVTEEITHHADNSFEHKHTYRYDSNGKTIEDIRYKSDTKISGKHAYSYSENGEKTEVSIYFPENKFLVRQFWIEDEKGNTTAFTLCNAKGKYLAKWTYLYEFDNAGNWTRQTLFMGEKPAYILERTIEYYE